MKKIILALLFGIAFFIPNFAFATKEGVVSITTRATKAVKPDTAYITLGVETTNKTAKEAIEANANNMNQLVKSLKIYISPNKGDNMETQSLNVYPQYKTINNEQTIVGYRAINTVQIKTKNLEKLSDLISTAITNGANKVNSLQFKIEDCNHYYQDLTTQSILMAKKKADIVATALNSKATKAKAISTSFSGDAIQNVNYMLSKSTTKQDFSKIPLMIEKIILEAITNAEFYLK